MENFDSFDDDMASGTLLYFIICGKEVKVDWIQIEMGRKNLVNCRKLV